MAIPVVLCGRTSRIATAVIAGLKPEYETIHLILNPSAGKTEIPLLLRGLPVTRTNDLGSKDYSKPPVAVILGAGYEDDDVDAMRKACSEAQAPHVPWLRPDASKPSPPLGPEYGSAMVSRLKVLLREMKGKGKLGIGNEGVFWF